MNFNPDTNQFAVINPKTGASLGFYPEEQAQQIAKGQRDRGGEDDKHWVAVPAGEVQKTCEEFNASQSTDHSPE